MTSFYIGTSGYGHKEWKGSFYPEDLPAKQMLRYYAQRFNTVEINASFYRLPSAATVESWAADVPDSFRFVLKAPQQITHFKRLKEETLPAMEAFLKVAGVLGRRLGPLFFQLPPNMKKDVPRLAAFLAHIPRRYRIAFEFRHATWFDDEVYAALRARNTALCIAEAEEGESGDVQVPFVATADWGYVRLRKLAYTRPKIRKWAERISAAGWKEAYVFFMHEETGTGPKFGTIMQNAVKA